MSCDCLNARSRDHSCAFGTYTITIELELRLELCFLILSTSISVMYIECYKPILSLMDLNILAREAI